MIELEEIINYNKLETYPIIKLPNCDDLLESITEDMNISTYKQKMKENNLTDEELIVYGNYLLENKDTISINKIIQFNNYLTNKIDIFGRFSPFKDELNNLLYNIEEYLEYKNYNNKNIKNKFIKSFDQDEIDFLNKILYFLDGNCRRNKRIINIFSISRYIMGKRIKGWYQNKVVNLEIKKKIIKLIILAEQWCYRLSWIFQKLKIYVNVKKSY